MTRPEIYEVLEALKSAQAELQTLADDDVYVSSGPLLEQIEAAVVTAERAYSVT